jgi:hypothetical protein
MRRYSGAGNLGGGDMKIEAGKYYRTRGGQVFGPMVQDAEYRTSFPWCLVVKDSEGGWTKNGRWSLGN